MKKTFNINVAGVPFIIDEDAYNLLSDYLNAIGHAFGKSQDNQELLSDIEGRVAELLLEYTSSGSPIVTAAQVEEVISRIGQPEQMIEVDEEISISEEAGTDTETESAEETETTEGNTTTPPPYQPPTPPKKLYRDSQNAMVGGVCSGLAWYFNWDATWVRLILLALILFGPFLFIIGSMAISFMLIAAYIILWICLPDAVTPIQRMQMMGEKPTIENIGKTVTDNFREDNGINSTTQRQQSKGVISKIFSIFVKSLVAFVTIVCIILLIGLSICLIGCIFALVMFFTVGFFGFLPFDVNGNSNVVFWGILCGIGAILFIGIPIYLIVRMVFNKKQKNMSSAAKWMLGILFAGGVILAAFSTGKIIVEARQLENNPNPVVFDGLTFYHEIFDDDKPLTPAQAEMKAEMDRHKAEMKAMKRHLRDSLRAEKKRMKREAKLRRDSIKAEKRKIREEVRHRSDSLRAESRKLQEKAKHLQDSINTVLRK